jgi:predicted membrane protein
MPDNRDEQSQPAPDYKRGYYDREGRWVEYRDLGQSIRDDVRRRAGRHFHHGGPATQGVIFAVILIALGVLLFLDNIGLFRFRDIWQFWPVLPIALGVAKLFDSKGVASQVWAAMWILVGAAFLFDHLGIWHMNWGTIWPLAIVAFGVTMLVNALDRRQRAPVGPIAGSCEGTTSDKTLREWATFGGIKRRVDTQDFQGGEMVAVFGGIEIDLRRAGIAPGNKEVVIDANATFGGIELRVPENWIVIMRGIGVFGGYEDKTIPPRESDRATAPRLVIKGYAVFGGVSVQN